MTDKYKEKRLKTRTGKPKSKSSLESRLNYYEIQGTPRPVRYVNIPSCGLIEFTREYGPNDGDGLTD